jgi:hypothetical protein
VYRWSVALAFKEFLTRNRLRFESRDGPPSLMSTTVTYTYRLEDLNETHSCQHSLYALRGIAKELFCELGGGEAFIRSERDHFGNS